MDKTLIFESTLRLLSESKKDISLDALAKALSIKKQSLYSYFPSKEALIKEALEYSSKSISIVEYKVELSSNVNETLMEIVRHYVGLFSKGLAREYLSLCGDLQGKNLLNLNDIKYSIETQLFFILDEIREKGVLKTRLDISSLSHILMLCIIDIIQSSQSDNEREFELSKLSELIEDLLG